MQSMIKHLGTILTMSFKNKVYAAPSLFNVEYHSTDTPNIKQDVYIVETEKGWSIADIWNTRSNISSEGPLSEKNVIFFL